MAPRPGYYDSLAAVAAAYCFGIAQSQAFLDGNKRTGVAVAGAFLGGNGHRVVLDADEFESLMIGIADGSATRDDLVAAFARAMGGDGIELEPGQHPALRRSTRRYGKEWSAERSSLV